MAGKQRYAVKTAIIAAVLLAAAAAAPVFCTAGQNKTEITDAAGRRIEVPLSPDRVICSGAGCMRLLTYMEAEDRAAAVDSMEKTSQGGADPRPYFLANPQLKDLPLSGEFRGRDNPELIAALDPQPEVIFKTFPNMGHDPEELQKKTGIPVVVLNYGNLTGHRQDLYRSLRIMGEVLGKKNRAEEIIGFFNEMIDDLAQRSQDRPGKEDKTCYVGGISYKGPHGVESTQPAYPPFVFTNARNVAEKHDNPDNSLSNARVAKEKILSWNPDIIFLDLSSTVSNSGGSALLELFSDPAYRHLDAVKKGRVYGVMPYNWYASNFGAVFANAYFTGKILRPERFSDVDPAQKADRIFDFLVGEPVFDRIDEMFEGRVFDRIEN
ncbi:MAG: iron ABC transporter substrate-binding protein [Desulfosalsimonas sp.]